MIEYIFPDSTEVSQVVNRLNKYFYHIDPSTVEKILAGYPDEGDPFALISVLSKLDKNRKAGPLSSEAAQVEYELASYISRDLLLQYGERLYKNASLFTTKAVIVGRFNNMEGNFVNTLGLNIYTNKRTQGATVEEALCAISKEAEKTGKKERKITHRVELATFIGFCAACVALFNHYVKKDEIPDNTPTAVQKVECTVPQQMKLKENQRSL